METSNPLCKGMRLLICLSLFALLFSCHYAAKRTGEKIMEKAIEQSTGEKTDVKLADKSAEITTESGKVHIDANMKSWPSEIPEDVPKFTQGSIDGVTFSNMNDVQAWTLVIKDMPVSALSDYDKVLRDKGFKTVTTMFGDKGGSITAEKGNLVVSLMGGEGKAALSVQISKQE